MSTASLERLHEHSKFGSASSILKDATLYYRRSFGWIASHLENPVGSDQIIDRIQKLSDVDATFLFRSSPIRYYIDKIVNGIFEVDTDEPASQRRDNWRNLSEAIVFIVHEDGSLNREAFSKHSLTEPYPLQISLWGADDQTHYAPWSESTEVSRMFSVEMADTVGKRYCVLRSPSDTFRLQFERAFEYLASWYPDVAQDLCAHVRHLSIIDYQGWESMSDEQYREIGQSVSSHLVPTCSFFSLYSVQSLPRLIESLYHEILHKKLSNLIITKSILKDGYNALDTPRFHSFWNKDTRWNSNLWEFDRTLYAYHVYIHLYCFYGSVMERKGDSVIDFDFAKRRRSDSLMRYEAMEPWLYENGPMQVMGEDGREFLDFMRTLANQSKEKINE
jgi:hypothetical protein